MRRRIVRFAMLCAALVVLNAESKNGSARAAGNCVCFIDVEGSAVPLMNPSCGIEHRQYMSDQDTGVECRQYCNAVLVAVAPSGCDIGPCQNEFETWPYTYEARGTWQYFVGGGMWGYLTTKWGECGP